MSLVSVFFFYHNNVKTTWRHTFTKPTLSSKCVIRRVWSTLFRLSRFLISVYKHLPALFESCFSAHRRQKLQLTISTPSKSCLSESFLFQGSHVTFALPCSCSLIQRVKRSICSISVAWIDVDPTVGGGAAGGLRCMIIGLCSIRRPLKFRRCS